MSIMRSALLLVLALVAASATARADSRKPAADQIDVEGIKSRLIFLHDGHGHYVALVPFDTDAPMFYGDGKTFHAQRVIGSSQNRGESTESRRFWAPTSVPRGGDIDLAKGKWAVRCSDRTTPVVTVNEIETGKLLARAVFKKPLWKRQAAVLGRDDDGVYYYVDRLRDDRSRNEQFEDPHPPTGFRLFVGRRGKLREQKLSDTTVDSKGLVLASKKGSLAVDDSAKRLVWSKGKKREELVYLPVEDNVVLIYRDLGLYGKLGVPCDHM